MRGFSIIFILKEIITFQSHGIKKQTNFDKIETESKMENSSHSFRELNHVLQLV